MIKKVYDFIKQEKLDILDIAIMDKNGIQSVVCQPAYECNECYSIAKLFIGTTIGVLCDKGLLSLDTPLMDVLESQVDYRYPSEWKQVTVEHALAHKMGVDYGIFDIDRDDPTDYGIDYLKYILEYPPKETPGERYIYTDTAHYLLSRVISKITGHPADELINEKLAVPMEFRQAAWSRCPWNYTIGSTGAFLRADDVVKLGWLYLNRGNYFGKQLISEQWVERAEQSRFDLDPVRNTGFIGKGGMNGQMVMYHKEKNIAVSWHGHDLEEKDRIIADFIENL